MANSFSFVCKFCQPKRSLINRDPGSGTKLVISDEKEDVSDGVMPAVNVSYSSQQSTFSRTLSNLRQKFIGRSSTSSGTVDSFGLKLFNAKNLDCTDAGDCQFDVIAVHGLNGHRENTWRFKEVSEQKPAQGPIWLRDFLPQDLPGSRIYTYGYNSELLANQSVSRVDDFALQLLRGLRATRIQHGERPIIFIAHSLGGIVTKRAINLAYEDRFFNEISTKIRGVIFMGTPHKGSDTAQWGTLIGKLLPTVHLRRDLLSTLQPDSETFQTIAEAFIKRADDLSIYTYYETNKLERFGISAIIVPRASAVLGLTREVVYPMERDHISMCCFANNHDDYYRLIVGDLKACAPEKIGDDLLVREDKPSQELDECLKWMERKGGSVESVSAPRPLRGTCNWLFQEAQFRKWLSPGTQSSLLWLTGPVGCGKTLLSTFLAENLGNGAAQDDLLCGIGHVNVCYFSCDQMFNSETNVVKILNTLLRQVLNERPDLANHALREWEKPGQQLLENFGLLWGVLVATLKDPRAGYTVIIIDAIDECEEAAQQLYTEYFKRLLHNDILARKMRVLFTSQHFEGVERQFRDVPNIQLGNKPYCDFVGQDVDLVIKTELDNGLRCLDAEKDQLKTVLCRQADRTYLWVQFVIEELKKLVPNTETLRKEVINGVPKRLEDRYEKSLSMLANRWSKDEGGQQYVVRLLMVISASLKPLDLDDLSSAMAISSVHSRLSEVEKDRDSNVEGSVCTILGSLVRFADRRVFFVHNSLTRYLTNSKNKSKDERTARYKYTNEAAHLQMAKICTTYLSLQDFDNDRFRRTPYPSESSCQSPDFDPEYSGVDFISESEDPDTLVKGSDFFDYCALNWTTHMTLAGQSAAEDTGIQTAVTKICAKDSFILRNWLGFYWTTLGPKKEVHHGFDPMVVASYFGLDAVILCLIDNGLVDVGRSGPRALYWAANEGKASVVKLLLSHNVPASFRSILGWTPLTRAAAAGHTETVEALLSVSEVEVDETTSFGRSALSFAIGNGHIEVARLLLKTPNIDVNNIDVEEDTPLLHAMDDGNLDVLRLLLEDGRTNLAHANRHDRTALSYAAEYGHIAIVKLLLHQSPDAINIRLENHRKRSPLLYAVEKGHLEIVKLLGNSVTVDFSVRDTEGFNTVILASKYHHVDILKYLSKRDPEGFNAVDIDVAPPLRFAFMGNSPRRLQAIDYLLDSNLVNLEHRGNSERTTLFRAATSGFVEGVQHLIDKGANVNALDKRGWTPLHLVVSEGQCPEMVSCLLENDADFEIRNNEGLTPFELAKRLATSQEPAKDYLKSQYSDIIKILGRKMKEVADLKAERKKAQNE